MPDDIHLDRLPDVLGQRRDGRSSLYLDIQRGVWTPPVKFGRASAWPHHEVQVLLRARIAGATKSEQRELVQRLIAQRRALLPQSMQAA